MDESTGNYIYERWLPTSDTFKTNWHIFLSDLRAHPEVKLGLSQEFIGRNDGWPGLKRAYDLPFETPRGLDHVHCKDVRAGVLADVLRDDRSFLRAVLDGVFTVPGDGSIDFAAVLRALRLAGYVGWLVVEAEQDPAKAHPLTYARLGYANLKRAAESAGFVVDER